jgi:hypothetical protein
MIDAEFQSRLRAGIGGPRLRRLRKRTAIATAQDFVKVGTLMVRPAGTDRESVREAVHAVGLLLQTVGELAFAAGRQLSGREHYAGAALLRQVVEIEYLTWTFKGKRRSPSAWLKSTHEERMQFFSPAQLRQTSKGRFLGKDYRDHCEQGGHPVPRGGILLGGNNVPTAQLLLVDLIVHCWRTWDQVVAWSSEFPRTAAVLRAHGSRISWRLDDWGKRDPVYELMVAVRPEKSAHSC